jgi:hypothetical protein
MTHAPSCLHLVLVGGVLSFGLQATAVHAQSAEGATAAPVSPARQAFAEGRRLAAAGNYAEACPKFEESLRLEVGVGTQFNLADCWERTGRTASAQALFLGAAASAKAAGQTDREQVLRDRATALEPRLTRLVIEVTSTDPKLIVKRGELPLESSSWGKAVAVDPGKYVISAKAPGKRPWQKTVDLTIGTPVVSVEVPELKAAEEKPVATPVPVAKPPVAAPIVTPPPSVDRDSSVNYRALSVAGIGVVAVGFGAYMGLKYLSANNDAKDICPSGQQCTIKQIQDHDKLVDDARSARTWSYGGFGVGALALLGAGTLWYFQRPQSSSRKSFRATPVLSADGSVGALVGGSF